MAIRLRRASGQRLRRRHGPRSLLGNQARELIGRAGLWQDRLCPQALFHEERADKLPNRNAVLPIFIIGGEKDKQFFGHPNGSSCR